MNSHASSATSLGPSRRTLVRSAAWSVPVVAMAAAAPAYAASCGVAETLNWANYADGTVFSSAQFGLTTLTITQTGNLGPDSGKVIYQPEGGVNPALRYYPSNNVNGSSVTVTLTFDRAVRDLSFRILDIDSSQNSNGVWLWRDRLAVLTAPSSAAPGVRIQGSGTEASPYLATSATALDNTSPDGNVRLTWNGPISQVSFRYFQAGTPTGTPHTGLSNISFTTIC